MSSSKIGNHNSSESSSLSPKINPGHNNQDNNKENVKLVKQIKIEAKLKDVLCQICKKTFSSLSHLKQHHKVHKAEHKCKYCEKIFRYSCLMLDHVKNVHENPGSYKCNVCKVTLSSNKNLIRHQRIHMKECPKPFKCNNCEYATDRNSSLKRHLKIHENYIERCDKCNRILVKNIIHDCRTDCKYCGKKFGHRESVRKHIRKHHAHESKISFYECDTCGSKFQNKNTLRIHMEAKHADGMLICDLDGKRFPLKYQLIKHMKSHQPPVKCDFCFKKLSAKSLKDHIKNFHTGIRQPKKIYIKETKIHQCPICSKILSKSSSLKRHIGDHNKTIKCKFCEKLFGDQSRLKDHVRDYHENLDRYICEICNKKCMYPSKLKTHMKYHDTNRPKDLKCTQCDFATDEKKSLEKHLNSHMRKNARIAVIKNPHKCPQCPSVLKSFGEWNGHIKNVHPKTLFECDICGKKMKQKSAMLSHLRLFHKINL